MFDIAIIGGGPAGLAAGIGLARKGFKTILFEKKSFPIDKPCGEGIMPPGVAILEQLGVLQKIPDWKSRLFEGIHYIAPNQKHVLANFSEGPGLALRRTVLSQALFQVASQTAGLTLEQNKTIQTLNSIKAKFVIGADGLRSKTREWLGIPAPLSNLHRYGAVQHYEIKPWNKKIEIHWSQGLEAYVTPCGENEIGLAFLWDKSRHEPVAVGKSLSDGFLSHFPKLQERLSSSNKIGTTQTIGPLCRPVPTVIAKQAALIGDAAGYLDPITGEGISLGLKSALLLTQCLCEEKPLSWYAKELKKSRRTYYLTTHALLFLSKQEGLFNGAAQVLARYPKLFQGLLSYNMGPMI